MTKRREIDKMKRSIAQYLDKRQESDIDISQLKLFKEN